MKKKLLLSLSLGLILTLMLATVAHAWLVGSRTDLSLYNSSNVRVETSSTVDNIVVYVNELDATEGVWVTVYDPSGEQVGRQKRATSAPTELTWDNVGGAAGTYTFKFDMYGSAHCDIELRDGVGGYR